MSAERPRVVEEPTAPADRPRRPYSPPVLFDYGRIQDLTQGGRGPQADFPSGSRTA